MVSFKSQLERISSPCTRAAPCCIVGFFSSIIGLFSSYARSLLSSDRWRGSRRPY